MLYNTYDRPVSAKATANTKIVDAAWIINAITRP